jgi:catechol 2,3-dioxygenase-like lactoylglutathione lyase family enzyme
MRLNHVTLPAADYAASVAFYTALGLHQIVAAPPRYARFEVDAVSTLSIEVMPAGRAGAAEIFLHCDAVDVDHAAAVARGLVFEFAPRDEDYRWRRAAITDPAGNRIVLFTAGTNQHFPPWRRDGRTA